MYEFFVFEVPGESGQDEPRGSTLVIFVSVPFPNAADVKSLISRRLGEENTSADRVLLLGIESNERVLRDLIASEDLKDSVSRITGGPAPVALWLGRDGQFHGLGTDAAYFEHAKFVSKMKRNGLMTIFDNRSGIVDTRGQGFHYVVPSSAHSDKFIRAANVLVRGAEVAFIALFLLEYLPSSTRHIYVDTSGISNVAYSLVALKQQLDRAFEPPTIDSFNSYQGLEEFSFDGKDESLFLISASTRGKLAPALIEKHNLQSKQCVTLFYLGNPDPAGEVLCDITKRGTDGIGHAPAEIYGTMKNAYSAVAAFLGYR